MKLDVYEKFMLIDIIANQSSLIKQQSKVTPLICCSMNQDQLLRINLDFEKIN